MIGQDLGGGLAEAAPAAAPDIVALARAALRSYSWAPDCDITVLDVSENTTVKIVDTQSGRPAVLRMHRLGYHTAKAVASELQWLRALRAEAGVQVPRALPTHDGEFILITSPHEGAPPRMCVAFEFLPGDQPPEDTHTFETLGEITARIHQHARSWHPPAGFTRFTWTCETTLCTGGPWGSWRTAPGLGPPQDALLVRLERRLRERLAAFGRSPDRFGLVHADLRRANLLVDRGQMSVIDFDDCGFSWYLYDLATAFSFIEHKPQVPELIDSWLRGYGAVHSISAAERQELWTFILLRRLLLTAWIGSHPRTQIACDAGSDYVAGTCELAERYLSRYG